MSVKKFLGVLFPGLIIILWGLSSRVLASQTTSPMQLTINSPALSVSLAPSADNTLYEDSTGTLSNGAGAYFFAGRTNLITAGVIRRGLIKFDVASSLPLTATIVGVTLTLRMSQTISGPQPIALHRVTASWGEGSSSATGGEGGGALAAPGDATWLHRFYSSTLWTKPGGDFVATASATTTVDTIGPYSWSAPGLVADVQQWLNSPSTNDGWLLSGNETQSNTTKRFDSRENPDPGARPVLVVTYLLLPNKIYVPLVLK